ncbi:MAG TPA: DNA-3-methyladenine glycosylase [Flavobacteriales bacterium]|nr:DNA-3-methyladenine glycosylase [Flavobacteriales bacterium]
MKLQPDFYIHKNTRKLARQLLGKFLCTNLHGIYTSGIITETEAYEGIHDKASHAYGKRLTNRTKTMYEKGGIAYIYLCYGLHTMFNVVTHEKDEPHAILVRGIKPVDGIEQMEKRRKMPVTKKGFSSGPGTVCKALGIEMNHNGIQLSGNKIWIEDRSFKIKRSQILVTKRIGIDYAGDDVHRLNRFVLTT